MGEIMIFPGRSLLIAFLDLEKIVIDNYKSKLEMEDML